MKKAKKGEPEGPKPRELAKQETREALLLAAISAFAEGGLDGPSLDSICARAGYTRGAFYVHFKDRDDLLAAAMQHVLQSFVDAMIVSGGANLGRTIETFVTAVDEQAFPLKGAVPLYQFLAACARTDRVRQLYVGVLEEAVRRLSDVVREGQRDGSVRRDVTAENLSLVLTALALGVQSLLELRYDFEVRPPAADLLRLLRPAVLPPR